MTGSLARFSLRAQIYSLWVGEGLDPWIDMDAGGLVCVRCETRLLVGRDSFQNIMGRLPSTMRID